MLAVDYTSEREPLSHQRALFQNFQSLMSRSNRQQNINSMSIIRGPYLNAFLENHLKTSNIVALYVSILRYLYMDNRDLVGPYKHSSWQ